MTTPFESLDEAFNINNEEVVDITPVEEAKPIVKNEVVPSNKADDREKDYQYARSNLYTVIEKMQETLEGAMEVAAESDHPRAFEVAFAGAKHLADVVDKLQDLHTKEKKLSEDSPQPTGGNQVNNGSVTNVFMQGTTNDLLKMLKESQQSDK